MSQAPFQGDRVELLGDFVGLTDNGNAVFALHFVGYYRWGDENADSRLAESLHQRAVVKLPHHTWPNLPDIEPAH